MVAGVGDVEAKDPVFLRDRDEPVCASNGREDLWGMMVGSQLTVILNLCCLAS